MTQQEAPVIITVSEIRTVGLWTTSSQNPAVCKLNHAGENPDLSDLVLHINLPKNVTSALPIILFSTNLKSINS